jgi:hypothetical protein
MAFKHRGTLFFFPFFTVTTNTFHFWWNLWNLSLLWKPSILNWNNISTIFTLGVCLQKFPASIKMPEFERVRVMKNLNSPRKWNCIVNTSVKTNAFFISKPFWNQYTLHFSWISKNWMIQCYYLIPIHIWFGCILKDKFVPS